MEENVESRRDVDFSGARIRVQGIHNTEQGTEGAVRDSRFRVQSGYIKDRGSGGLSIRIVCQQAWPSYFENLLIEELPLSQFRQSSVPR